MAAAYVPLWCKSNFSFLEGASHPEELVEEAQRLGLTSLALTDRDGLYGVVRAHVKAKELGVHLIVGAQMHLDDEGQVLLLAMDRSGYGNLCQLITDGRLRSEKGSCVVSWREIAERGAGLLALLVRCQSAPLGELRAAYGDRLYAVLGRHRRADEVPHERGVRAMARQHEIPLVAANEVLYHSLSRRPIQDVLTCVRHGVTLHEAGRLIKPNAEHHLKTAFLFEKLFADDARAVGRSCEIAQRCLFSLDEIRYRYPSEQLPDGLSSSAWLRQLTLRGAHHRYQGAPPVDVQTQIENELGLIDELDYCGYFLTMWEVVDYCRQQKILCQGRGSAANSVVCYCLGITAVDPLRLGLLFERFISRERAEPPDIDLDIEHERREEVIQHVYQKYGRDRAAMVANVIRYRARSALRDVGKTLGIAETELDRLAKLLHHYDKFDEGLLQVAGCTEVTPAHQQLIQLTAEIMGFPRHLSIHPGGFLLGHEAVSTLVPIENGSMADRTVIQWDKDDVEALGLFKVDLLALGALTHLHRCFDLIERHHGKAWSIASLPHQDEATFDMISRGDTVGVFQIESRAQMSMLPRLRPRTYYDLVIQISIVRPGPITGGMVHPYLRRRNGDEVADYPHECLKPVLEKTLGVPLFQEQVMRLAMVGADYTPGEADQLRRDMAAWQRTGRMEKHRERLISRMQKKGIALEFAERVFKQILGFGEYGFPESHAASFALISYAGAYLKWHYPAVFTCGILNAQPMGFYQPATLVEDAKRHGVEILPIAVEASDWDCTLEKIDGGEWAVRMGLRFVQSLMQSQGQRIVDLRQEGPFSSLEDFVRRTDLNERTVRFLAQGGAFEGFGKSRRTSLWEAQGLQSAPPVPLAVDQETPAVFSDLSRSEMINWDYQRTGHSVRGHPLAPFRAILQQKGMPDARAVTSMRSGQRIHYAGLVICRQRPGTASGVTFMTLEDETGFVNVVIWKQVFEAYMVQVKTLAFVGITGKVQAEEGVVHLIAESLWRPPHLSGMPADAGSRDFH